MRCSKHRARKVASRTLPSTGEGSCGYPRGGVDRTPRAALDRDRRPAQRVKAPCSTFCPALPCSPPTIPSAPVQTSGVKSVAFHEHGHLRHIEWPRAVLEHLWNTIAVDGRRWLVS